jgi:uncharacterized protein (DUF1501 family)
MDFWHTDVPNGGEALGWLGRLADHRYDPATRNMTVNIGTSQALAVRAASHSPLVFDDPARFRREGTDDQLAAVEALSESRVTANSTLKFLVATARNAVDRSEFVREASANYRSTVDYGIGGALGGGLQRVVALIAAQMPTRLYYVTYPGNQFDTHVHQADPHGRLLMYTADAVRAFMEDLKLIGRDKDVAVMMFTEFGRRVEENGSPRDRSRHGHGLKGGFYGRPPSLTDLDDGNLKMTTDFRSVYATMIREWLG